MTNSRISVLLIDDNPKLTAVWEKLLRHQPDMTHAGTLSSSEDVVATATRIRADVVLMDLTMAGFDPLVAIATLAADCPSSRVLVYSARSDADIKQRVLDAGAWGIVDKLEDVQNVLGAVRRVATGEIVVL